MNPTFFRLFLYLFRGPFVQGDQIGRGPFVQGDQIVEDRLSRGTKLAGDQIGWGLNWLGTICPGGPIYWGPNLGDQMSGDQMRLGPNVSQPSSHPLNSFLWRSFSLSIIKGFSLKIFPLEETEILWWDLKVKGALYCKIKTFLMCNHKLCQNVKTSWDWTRGKKFRPKLNPPGKPNAMINVCNLLKVRKTRSHFFMPTFPPKNKQMNSTI